jgi:hypothetical protein
MKTPGWLVESGLENQVTGQVHQDIQWISHCAGAGQGQDTFEKDPEQDNGQESVESRQRESTRPKGQPMGGENHTQHKRQTEQVVPVTADPPRRAAPRFGQTDQDEQQNQDRKQPPPPGNGLHIERAAIRTAAPVSTRRVRPNPPPHTFFIPCILPHGREKRRTGIFAGPAGISQPKYYPVWVDL